MEFEEGPTLTSNCIQEPSAQFSQRRPRDDEPEDLPEACIATILSNLPPRDVARAACVCNSYRLASRSDSVWKSLLPHGYENMLDRITDRKPAFTSKRDIFIYLSTPKLFADGKLAYWLDPQTGGVCLSLSARGMNIAWGATNHFWDWKPNRISLLHSLLERTRFPYRAQLRRPSGWRQEPVHFSFSKNDIDVSECMCYIDTDLTHQATENYNLPTIRILEDGWQEYNIAEFYVDRDEPTCVLNFSMRAIQIMSSKSGISLDGVVVRQTSAIKHLYRES